MASTTEHISIRLPKDLVDHLREISNDLDRSLNWVITRKLSGLPLETNKSREHDHQVFVRMAESLQVPEPDRDHAPNCRCYVCKPPK